MLSIFLKHQWTGFWRSRHKTGTIVAKVIMGILVLYLIGVCILVGYSMEGLIDHFLPGKDVFEAFNGIILYYFAVDFIVRLQMQELPTIAIVPYLHLNIPKKKLVSFLNISSLISAINLFPILIFFPFCLLGIWPEFGNFAGAMYLLSILSLIVFNNYAVLYFKRISEGSFKVVLPGIVALGIVAALEYYKVLSIAAFSNYIFMAVAAAPVYGFIFPIVATAMFLINNRYLNNNLYVEELKSASTPKSGTDYPLLDRFGAAGTLVALEIKMIRRNKRPNATVMKGLILLLYGFIFYKREALDHNEFNGMLFSAIFITGNTIFIYGQFMFGWQGAEFDGMLANKVNIRDFFRAKIILLSISATILTVLTSFYGLISWKILLIQFAAYFYNMGVSTVIVLYFATRNYKYIDIRKGARFNWQGVNATTMLVAIPFLVTPYLVYLPLSLISPYWGLAGLTLFGLAGILTRSLWIDLLVKEFEKRRYTIAAGFRERS